jgi:hypothetical protein
MMLTTHLHVVPRLRMCRAILPIRPVLSWLCKGKTLLWDLHEDFIINKKKIEVLRNELSALSGPLYILFLDGSSQSVLVHMLNLCHL